MYVIESSLFEKITRLIPVAAIHSLTDTCFRKCIPAGNVKNGKLDKYEEPCMRQCVDRFLDANYVVMKELERLRQ
jgi:import inner membrane translocase subunit TIM8